MSCIALGSLRALLKTKEIPFNETPAFCADCGSCCNSQPGIYAPDQFETREEILSLLKSGSAVIDWWDHSEVTIDEDGDEEYVYKQLLFIRPKMKSDPHIRAARWPKNSPCSQLSAKGCMLDWSKRPHSCRTLKAFDKGDCSSMYYDRHGENNGSKYLLAKTWNDSKFDLREIEEEAEG